MGYLIKQNKFVTHQFTLDSSVVKTCGTLPIYLMDLSPNGFDSTIFIPLTATLRNVNQTVNYNFGSQSHPTLQCSGVFYFVWQILLNNMASNLYAYTSVYCQSQNNYSGKNFTGNAEDMKSGNVLTLTTHDGNDAINGNGQLIITISGFNTTI